MTKKKNKYDITVKTNLPFEELVRRVVTAPKESVEKVIKATSKKKKPKTD